MRASLSDQMNHLEFEGKRTEHENGFQFSENSFTANPESFSDSFIQRYRRDVSELKLFGNTIREEFDRVASANGRTSPLPSSKGLQKMMREYIIKLNGLALSCLEHNYFIECSRLLEESNALCENCEGEPYYIEVKVITLNNLATCARVKADSFSTSAEENFRFCAVNDRSFVKTNSMNKKKHEHLENALELFSRSMRLVRRNKRLARNELPLIYLNSCAILSEMNKNEGALRYAQLAVCFSQKKLFERNKNGSALPETITSQNNKVSKEKKTNFRAKLIESKPAGIKLLDMKVYMEDLMILAFAYYNLAVSFKKTNHFDLCVQWHQKAKDIAIDDEINHAIPEEVKYCIVKAYREAVKKRKLAQKSSGFLKNGYSKLEQKACNALYPPAELNKHTREKYLKIRYKNRKSLKSTARKGDSEPRAKLSTKVDKRKRTKQKKRNRQSKSSVRHHTEGVTAWEENHEENLQTSNPFREETKTWEEIDEENLRTLNQFRDDFPNEAKLGEFNQTAESAQVPQEKHASTNTNQNLKYVHSSSSQSTIDTFLTQTLEAKPNMIPYIDLKDGSTSPYSSRFYQQQKEFSTQKEKESLEISFVSSDMGKMNLSTPHRQLVENVSKLRNKKETLWKRSISKIETRKREIERMIEEEHFQRELRKQRCINLEKEFSLIQHEMKEIDQEEEKLIRSIREENIKRNMWRKARLDLCKQKKHELEAEMAQLREEEEKLNAICTTNRKMSESFSSSGLENRLQNFKSCVNSFENQNPFEIATRSNLIQNKIENQIDELNHSNNNDNLVKDAWIEENKEEQEQDKNKKKYNSIRVGVSTDFGNQFAFSITELTKPKASERNNEDELERENPESYGFFSKLGKKHERLGINRNSPTPSWSDPTDAHDNYKSTDKEEMTRQQNLELESCSNNLFENIKTIECNKEACSNRSENETKSGIECAKLPLFHSESAIMNTEVTDDLIEDTPKGILNTKQEEKETKANDTKSVFIDSFVEDISEGMPIINKEEKEEKEETIVDNFIEDIPADILNIKEEETETKEKDTAINSVAINNFEDGTSECISKVRQGENIIDNNFEEGTSERISKVRQGENIIDNYAEDESDGMLSINKEKIETKEAEVSLDTFEKQLDDVDGKEVMDDGKMHLNQDGNGTLISDTASESHSIDHEEQAEGKTEESSASVIESKQMENSFSNPHDELKEDQIQFNYFQSNKGLPAEEKEGIPDESVESVGTHVSTYTVDDTTNHEKKVEENINKNSPLEYVVTVQDHTARENVSELAQEPVKSLNDTRLQRKISANTELSIQKSNSNMSKDLEDQTNSIVSCIDETESKKSDTSSILDDCNVKEVDCKPNIPQLPLGDAIQDCRDASKNSAVRENKSDMKQLNLELSDSYGDEAKAEVEERLHLDINSASSKSENHESKEVEFISESHVNKKNSQGSTSPVSLPSIDGTSKTLKITKSTPRRTSNSSVKSFEGSLPSPSTEAATNIKSSRRCSPKDSASAPAQTPRSSRTSQRSPSTTSRAKVSTPRRSSNSSTKSNRSSSKKNIKTSSRSPRAHSLKSSSSVSSSKDSVESSRRSSSSSVESHRNSSASDLVKTPRSRATTSDSAKISKSNSSPRRPSTSSVASSRCASNTRRSVSSKLSRGSRSIGSVNSDEEFCISESDSGSLKQSTQRSTEVNSVTSSRHSSKLARTKSPITTEKSSARSRISNSNSTPRRPSISSTASSRRSSATKQSGSSKSSKIGPSSRSVKSFEDLYVSDSDSVSLSDSSTNIEAETSRVKNHGVKKKSRTCASKGKSFNRPSIKKSSSTRRRSSTSSEKSSSRSPRSTYGPISENDSDSLRKSKYTSQEPLKKSFKTRASRSVNSANEVDQDQLVAEKKERKTINSAKYKEETESKEKEILHWSNLENDSVSSTSSSSSSSSSSIVSSSLSESDLESAFSDMPVRLTGSKICWEKDNKGIVGSRTQVSFKKMNSFESYDSSQKLHSETSSMRELSSDSSSLSSSSSSSDSIISSSSEDLW